MPKTALARSALGGMVAAFSVLFPVDAQVVGGAAGILVEPNVRVTRHGDFAHGESDVAANPVNALNLLGSAISFSNSGPGSAYETKAFTSLDGGWTWTDVRLPGQELGAWDTQVRFGVTGTAYLLTWRRLADTARHNALAFYRSEDGGLTWSVPVDLHHRIDRNVIVVDHSRGPYRGRVYAASHGAASHGSDGVVLYRSSDDGRSFEGPVRPGCRFAFYMLVLRDGTLWVPCFSVTDSAVSERLAGRHGATWSTDGGETFSEIIPVPTCTDDCVDWDASKSHPGDVTGSGAGNIFAVDTTAHFRDRIYAVWLRRSGDGQRMALSHSDDQGRTWIPARDIPAPSQAGAKQYLPMAAVNRDGILGVFWFETIPPDYKTYQAFFSASLDGGDGFLPARRVTSVASRPDQPGNRALAVVTPDTRGRRSIVLYGGYNRFHSLGEYTGLAADAEGVFHAFWPDARDGAFQVYTSRVSVRTLPLPEPPAHVRDSARAVDDAVEVLFEPSVIPHGVDEIVRARLRNVSADTVWGPLELVVRFGATPPGAQAFAQLEAGAIFDPESERWSRSARIDYTAAMRDLPFLAPGGTTEALPWRFRGVSRVFVMLERRVWSGHRSPRRRPGTIRRRAVRAAAR